MLVMRAIHQSVAQVAQAKGLWEVVLSLEGKVAVLLQNLEVVLAAESID